ncbi:hypothetical protein C8A01DRAFT_14094 [Parachaetomium inaequale]|uniref:F-box domain-containing protein n=1 Tax=Parachaetomium inaequale TaxID=2588326 RepID=A0AAN6SU73_9PEZI|nr:hypothetical protein C8A01DRAFT_14094 [Parachaetomium inaequale]
MALVRLPSELLLHILSEVGSQFFAKDARRLTVSKRWFSFAWLVFARELRVTSQSLARFLADEEAFRRVQPHLRSFNFFLQAFVDDPGFDPLRLHDGTFQHCQTAWRAETDSSLTRLATALQQCPRLESLRFAVSIHTYGLASGTIADLISARHLTSLDLDLGGGPIPVVDNPGRGTHLCPRINALLPSLRRLRCRMSFMCGALLKPLETESPLQLEEVIINLTQTKPGAVRKSMLNCRDPLASTRLSAVNAAFEDRATALAGQLRKPRMVRVIMLKMPGRRVYAYDAVEQRRVWLGPEAEHEWDADGEVMTED